MNLGPFTLSALALAAASSAQADGITLYGRVDLSVAQQADATSNREVRNGSGSRLGVRGVEDLGGGLKALFHIEHRFNADDGASSSTRFWEGKSIVGLEGAFGRVTFGREENPAYTYAQGPADPWGLDTVASNGSLVNGRIGSTRYSNAVNYRMTAGAFTFGAQVAEAEGNPSASGGSADDRPYSAGLAYANGPWRIAVGFENPADADDRWASLAASYDLRVVKLGVFLGEGRNADAQHHRSWLVSAAAPVGGGEVRASYGRLENHDAAANGVLDDQIGLGYHRPLSKRTTLYADLVHEGRDAMPEGRRRTGWDVGLKHNF